MHFELVIITLLISTDLFFLEFTYFFLLAVYLFLRKGGEKEKESEKGNE